MAVKKNAGEKKPVFLPWYMANIKNIIAFIRVYIMLYIQSSFIIDY